ncbi:hypothetical protein NMY22_g3207 [Coprinellus aureogranulatus]|nr:hypothetical protein NMY22_g3207 [Coprinellus aureogranulatus]
MKPAVTMDIHRAPEKPLLFTAALSPALPTSQNIFHFRTPRINTPTIESNRPHEGVDLVSSAPTAPPSFQVAPTVTEFFTNFVLHSDCLNLAAFRQCNLVQKQAPVNNCFKPKE